VDYYTVLGVSPKAPVDEIERAFRKLAREVHPDLNTGDAARADARMKQLNQIRETLADPLLRAAYDDQLRRETEAFRPPPPQRPREAPSSHAPPRYEQPPRYEPHPHVAPFLRTEAQRQAAEVRRPARGPAVAMIVLSALTIVGVVLLWPHPEPAANMPIAIQPPPPPPAPPRPAVTVVRGDTSATRRAIRRTAKVVPPGASLDDVIHQFGPPDRIESHPEPGDVTLIYGKVRVELREGKVVGGEP